MRNEVGEYRVKGDAKRKRREQILLLKPVYWKNRRKIFIGRWR